jgi:hypothetical protein
MTGRPGVKAGRGDARRSPATLEGVGTGAGKGGQMQKKTGTAGTIVPPAAPTEALEADTANPGEVEDVKAVQKEAKTGKYGSVPAQPMKPPEGVEADKLSWIGVELKDADGDPVPGVRFQVRNAQGAVAGGTTGPDGKGKVEGIAEGQYDITFPELDGAVWEPA